MLGAVSLPEPFADVTLLVIVLNILTSESIVLNIDLSESLIFRQTLMGESEGLALFEDKGITGSLASQGLLLFIFKLDWFAKDENLPTNHCMLSAL